MINSDISGSEDFEGSVYYRQRGILVLARNFVAEPGDRTHGRHSIRLMLGCSAPFEVEFTDGRVYESRALLLSHDSGLCAIRANNCDFALFDFSVASAEYAAVLPLLERQPMLSFT
ncbi:MAG: hypothetical protein SV765_09330 [Pseudomonadota bacterium]|nr:hypothetical protein [Pseudomonadota bacterium]